MTLKFTQNHWQYCYLIFVICLLNFLFYSNSRPILHHLPVRYRDALVVTNAVLQIDVLLLLVFYTTTMSLSVTIYLLPDTAILRGVCE